MKKQKTDKSNSKKIVAVSVTIVISIVIAILASSLISNTATESSESSDPRIINWRHVHGVGLDPVDNSILYIATHGDFYKSVNDGPPLKVDRIRADYMAFTAPPVSGVPLYASGHPSTGGNTGLIKSENGGITWELVSSVLEPPVDFHAMAISKQSPEIIIGFDSGARGLFKTMDAGKTWNTLEYPEYITSLAIHPEDSELIFAGTGKGIFKSDNGGKTWIALKAYQGLLVPALSFDNDGVLFASTETFGIGRSNDLGESWENLLRVDLTVTSIAADSENNSLYIAGYSSGGFQEVYKINYDSNSYEMIGTNKGLR